jgi:hypothetical protein
LSDTEIQYWHNNIFPSTGLVAQWQPATVKNIGSTTTQLTDTSSASYGIQNMVKPWIVLYDPANANIDFYLFSYRPKKLEFKKDETGTIYELTLFPGNGNIYHGRIFHCAPARDSNSDLIPDFLSPTFEGSLQKFLQSCGFAEDWYYEYDLSTSAITPNDFSMTDASLDIVPFATSEGDSVSTTNNVVLPVSETVTTATGNVSIVDIRGLSAVRVRDTAYTNAGECKVWDTVTVGNTIESTWIRVYDASWVFTGDLVVENGLIRYKLSTSQISNFYVWVTNAWVLYAVLPGSVTFSAVIQLNTPDKISVLLTKVTDSTQTVLSVLKGECIFYNSGSSYSMRLDGLTGRFCITDSEILDGNTTNFSINTIVTTDTSSQYACGINPTKTFLTVGSVPSGGITAYARANNGGISAIYSSTSNLKYKFGAIPFDCTKLYTDAANLTGGDTI